MNKKSKTVLITGSSSGIGKETAFLFAKDGYNVILTYYDIQEDGIKAKQECGRLGSPKVLLFQLDLNNNESIRYIYGEIKREFDNIDILINNAGYKLHVGLEDTSFEEIDKQMSSNLIGAIKLTKLLLPSIKQSIVNIGSTLGFVGKKNAIVYCAAKFGVRGFSKALAKENFSLRINTVNPSLTNTAMGNLHGMSVNKVAGIVFNTAVGNYKVKSGLDINTRDYRFGEFVAKIIIFLKRIKRILKNNT